MVFSKKLHWNRIFLVLSGKMIFLKTLHENMIFSVYMVKIIFLFDTNMIFPSVKKTKMIFFRKIHLKMTFPVSLKKMKVILENMVFLLSEKLKMVKRLLSQIHIGRASTINVNNTFDKFVIINLLSLICKTLHKICENTGFH